MFKFEEPGQIVIVQLYERESGVKFGIDDSRYNLRCNPVHFKTLLERPTIIFIIKKNMV